MLVTVALDLFKRRDQHLDWEGAMTVFPTFLQYTIGGKSISFIELGPRAFAASAARSRAATLCSCAQAHAREGAGLHLRHHQHGAASSCSPYLARQAIIGARRRRASPSPASARASSAMCSIWHRAMPASKPEANSMPPRKLMA